MYSRDEVFLRYSASLGYIHYSLWKAVGIALHKIGISDEYESIVNTHVAAIVVW